MSAGESNPTHLSTPGCEQRVVKFALLGGGVGDEVGGAEAPELSPEPPPPPPHAATAKVRIAANERFLIVVVIINGALLVLVEEEGGAGATGLRNERHHAVVGDGG